MKCNQIVHAWKVRIHIKAAAAVTERKINKRNKVEVYKVIIYNNLSPWNVQTKLH